VQKFSATLKEALQEAVKSGGPVNGIAVVTTRPVRSLPT
jgi:hypothetical protein